MEPWEWQEPCVAAAWLTLGVCNHLELKPASPLATVKRGKQEQVMGESNVINDNNQDRTKIFLNESLQEYEPDRSQDTSTAQACFPGSEGILAL